ncbi:DUF2950 domain-containing protein [Falsiroseomonas sp. HW251]|uniref:DUF2950 domain-containing protein n=1 Tax=Falsiroseomonas sp. HW251 TaxID=3390998 RepID=UPI003D322588
MRDAIASTIRGALAALLVAGAAWAQAPAADTAGAPSEPRAEAPRAVAPQAFGSPEDGFAAFVAAIRSGEMRRLERVIGSANMPLVRDIDPGIARQARERFLAAQAEKSEITRPSPDRAVLQVGPDGWPLPLPLVRRGNAWRFDSAAARQEILDRRIGRNELDTIETLRAIADAQDDYARTAGRQGAFSAYARRFFSTPGQRDGLYWDTAPGEPGSPLGPMLAAASAGGYARTRADTPQPFHGYLFRMLERQGPAAPGGAADYVVNGRMIGGWAAIATPYRWGSTGIMTFMISHAGDVWQANLGPETARIAAGIASFDPGQGWEKVAD